MAALRRQLDKADAEESLAAYVRLMWGVIEPATPLVWGWVLDGMCDHLEAVADGERAAKAIVAALNKTN